jgi:hypothetical protein
MFDDVWLVIINKLAKMKLKKSAFGRLEKPLMKFLGSDQLFIVN